MSEPEVPSSDAQNPNTMANEQKATCTDSER